MKGGAKVNNARASSTAGSQNSGKPTQFFHYTDRNSAAKISSSGRVNESKGSGDSARLGPGVYVTSRTPNPKSTILANNYGRGAGSSASKAHKADAYVRIPAQAVEGRVTSGQDGLERNVYKISGPVDLKGTGAVVGRNTNE